MLTFNNLKVIVPALLLLAIAGCGGGGEPGGGVILFKTVSVDKPQITPSGNYLSDLATWVDTNGDSTTEVCGADGYTIVNDTVTASIAVTALGTNSPSDVLVETGTLSFRPADSNTPALPLLFREQPITANTLIKGGTTGSIPLELINHDMKVYVGDQILCTGITWNYYAKIVLSVVEKSTGERGNIETEILVRIADYADAK